MEKQQHQSLEPKPRAIRFRGKTPARLQRKGHSCSFWKAGGCKYGDNCNFVHEEIPAQVFENLEQHVLVTLIRGKAAEVRENNPHYSKFTANNRKIANEAVHCKCDDNYFCEHQQAFYIHYLIVHNVQDARCPLKYCQFVDSPQTLLVHWTKHCQYTQIKCELCDTNNYRNQSHDCFVNIIPIFQQLKFRNKQLENTNRELYEKTQQQASKINELQQTIDQLSIKLYKPLPIDVMTQTEINTIQCGQRVQGVQKISIQPSAIIRPSSTVGDRLNRYEQLRNANTFANIKVIIPDKIYTPYKRC